MLGAQLKLTIMEDTEEPVDKLGMTDEQWEWFQKATHGNGDQDENGVDLSLLRENLRLTPTQRLDKLQDAINFFHGVNPRSLKSSLNFTLVTDIGALDILGEPSGVISFDELWERSANMEVHGLPVHVASLDDLIAMKRAAGRIKDQGHLLELEALRKLIQGTSTTTG